MLFFDSILAHVTLEVYVSFEHNVTIFNTDSLPENDTIRMYDLLHFIVTLDLDGSLRSHVTI